MYADLRLILDSVPALVCTVTPDGEVDFANRPLLDYLGVRLEQLQDWSSFVHETDRGMVIDRWQHSVDTGQPFEAEYRLRRSDGVYRWFHGHAVPIRGEDGAIVRWCNLITDTGERQRWAILDNIPALVAIHNASGELELYNRAAREYHGPCVADPQQWKISDVVHPDDLPALLDARRRAVETGEAVETEPRLRRVDGEYRWFHVRAVRCEDDDGASRWYSVRTDIHDRKLAEEALRDLQARMSRAAQVAAAGELAGSIAHEVNQPLAAVVANGHALLRWLSASPPNVARAVEAAERIVKDGKDAGEVVRRVRALFKRAAVEKVQLDLGEVIGEVLRLLDSYPARKHVALDVALDSDLPPLFADRVQLQQLLLNLMLNALEALEPVRGRAKQLWVRAIRGESNHIVIQVSDNGIGFDDPVAAFEPFVTTKPEGMGLGLAICRSIVAAHDGRLSVEPREGFGTTFTVALPVQPGGSP